MTPQVAERLTIHEPDAVDPELAVSTVPSPRSGAAARLRALRPVEEGRAAPARQRREALQRRLLAVADVLATTLALWLVLSLPGTGDRPALLVLAGMPLVVVVF